VQFKKVKPRDLRTFVDISARSGTFRTYTTSLFVCMDRPPPTERTRMEQIVQIATEMPNATSAVALFVAFVALVIAMRRRRRPSKQRKQRQKRQVKEQAPQKA
jgi:hypothetical protein